VSPLIPSTKKGNSALDALALVTAEPCNPADMEIITKTTKLKYNEI